MKLKTHIEGLIRNKLSTLRNRWQDMLRPRATRLAGRGVRFIDTPLGVYLTGLHGAVLCVVFAVFLGGCASGEAVYPKFTRTDIPVHIVQVDNVETVCSNAKKMTGSGHRLACARFTANGTCTIFVGTNENRTDVWGHEFLHCVYGDWHA